MSAHRWTADTSHAHPGAQTHAYREPTRDWIDDEVRSACGYTSTTRDRLINAPTTVPQHEGCAFCRRALGMGVRTTAGGLGR